MSEDVKTGLLCLPLRLDLAPWVGRDLGGAFQWGTEIEGLSCAHEAAVPSASCEPDLQPQVMQREGWALCQLVGSPAGRLAPALGSQPLLLGELEGWLMAEVLVEAAGGYRCLHVTQKNGQSCAVGAAACGV